eukprot:5719226-Pyramimonas_sp.AAC.1
MSRRVQPSRRGPRRKPQKATTEQTQRSGVAKALHHREKSKLELSRACPPTGGFWKKKKE